MNFQNVSNRARGGGGGPPISTTHGPHTEDPHPVTPNSAATFAGGLQRPYSLEYQNSTSAIPFDTAVTGMTWTAFAILAMFSYELMLAPDFQIELVSKLDFNAKCISLKAHVLQSLPPVIVDLLECPIEQSLTVPSIISFMSQ